jgi:hypothetical protein
MLCPIKKKPAAQTAHLVFADTKANAKKNQKSCFLPTHTENNEN